MLAAWWELFHAEISQFLWPLAGLTSFGRRFELRRGFRHEYVHCFPNISYGVMLNLPIRNRTAQADAARALLEQRQLQMKFQNAKDHAVWDVSKAVSAVQQARDRLDAALNW